MTAQEAILNSLENRLDAVSSWICDGMQNRLIDHDHVDTGALVQSIRHEIGREGSTITSYIIADAKSQEGTEYAEFIELGTGAAHGRPGGRVGSWRYRDRNGKWHTTTGMDADPFIAPAVEEHRDFIMSITDDIIFDLEKYWKTKGGSNT